MINSTPPSRNLAGDGTLIGAFELFKQKFLQNTDDMLPAQVIAYDRATNRAQVQPLISQVTTDGTLILRGQIASIPVLQIGGGGFVISMPIQTGDLGWIKANDRDITFFLQTYAQSAPNTQRKHTFSDALFIPDSFMKGVTIAGEDANNLVIQNLAGTVRVAIWGDQVKITAPNIILNAPTTTCTGNLVVDGTSLLTGAVTADSTLQVSGDITADSDMIVTSNLNVTGTSTMNGIPFGTHVHGGVQSGSSDTGVPI
jgi:phage baseplate assembly protein gpV